MADGSNGGAGPEPFHTEPVTPLTGHPSESKAAGPAQIQPSIAHVTSGPTQSMPSTAQTVDGDPPPVSQQQTFVYPPGYEVSPEEHRANRVLYGRDLPPPTGVQITRRASTSSSNEADIEMDRDEPGEALASPVKTTLKLLEPPIINDIRVPLPPGLDTVYTSAQAFKDTVQGYAAAFSQALPDWAFHLIPHAFSFSPADSFTDFACHQRLAGCPFHLKGRGSADGQWRLETATYVHQHVLSPRVSVIPPAPPASLPPLSSLLPQLALPATKLRDSSADPIDMLRPRAVSQDLLEPPQSNGRKRRRLSTDIEEEDEEMDRPGVANRGALTSIVHPQTGKWTQVRLRNSLVHPVTYAKDLPPHILPPIHTVFLSRDALKEALDAYGQASHPVQTFKATSSNRNPGSERIVYSCSHYNKNKHAASCPFMIRAKRMPENGLWIVTTLNPAHSPHGERESSAGAPSRRGRAKERSVTPLPPSELRSTASLQPPRSARRLNHRLKESSEEPTDVSEMDDTALAPNRSLLVAPRPGRGGKRLKSEEVESERDMSPGLVGNYNYRAERTPLSDDEPLAPVVAMPSPDDMDVVESSDLSGGSDDDFDRPLLTGRGPRGGRGSRGGRARAVSGLARSTVPAKIRRFEDPLGTFIGEASAEDFDRRLAWPTNKRLVPCHTFLTTYLEATLSPTLPSKMRLVVLPAEGDSLETYLGKLHPSLAAAGGALRQIGISEPQALLSVAKADLSVIEGLTRVQRAMLAGRLPLRR